MSIKIKEIRLQKKFTQMDMSESLNISQNAYSLIENGTTKLIDLERINIISRKLGVSPFELGLFEGLDVPFLSNKKVENATNGQTENLVSNDLLISLISELRIKNAQLEQFMQNVNEIVLKLKPNK
jgi:transcriptional regulator with XRE-family HTH domain